MLDRLHKEDRASSPTRMLQALFPSLAPSSNALTRGSFDIIRGKSQSRSSSSAILLFMATPERLRCRSQHQTPEKPCSPLDRKNFELPNVEELHDIYSIAIRETHTIPAILTVFAALPHLLQSLHGELHFVPFLYSHTLHKTLFILVRRVPVCWVPCQHCERHFP